MAEAQKGKKRFVIAGIIIGVCLLCCAAVVGVKYGFAVSSNPDNSVFGVGTLTSSTTTKVGSLAAPSSAEIKAEAEAEAAKTAANKKSAATSDTSMVIKEGSALERGAVRDISLSVTAIIDRKEAARIAAEKAQREYEAACLAAAEAAKSCVDTSILPDVDFSVGEAAFVEEWGGRINAYLAGSPLAGYGDVFAQAAFANGVDPRWSPAISNTESGKGSVCFRAYNAWGWGGPLGNCWEDSIRSHIAGLAAGYGYTISVSAAQKYCPPNWSNWYNNTLSQMALI